MDEKQPNLITSGYSKHITQDGITIELYYKGTSIVWDDVFPTDDAAYMEYKRTVRDEGMKSFLDNGNIIQFPR